MSISKNKQAYFDYEILDTFEAGLVLSGPEVKSIKTGHINLKGAYINITNNYQAYLLNAHVSAYHPAVNHQRDYDPYRQRQLLLHAKELRQLYTKNKEAGLTIVPLEIYLSHGLIKLKIGIARGKKKHDKRESIKQKDFERSKRQELKQHI